MRHIVSAAALVLATLTLTALTTAPALAQTAPPAPAVAPTVDQATAKNTLNAFIADLRNGTPNYAAMDPKLAEALKPQVGQVQGALVQLGAVKSMTFVQLGPQGGYLFRVAFENGATDWVIHFNADKKVDGLFFRPAQAQ